MALVDVLSELEPAPPGRKPWADFVFDITRHVESASADIGEHRLDARAESPEGEIGWDAQDRDGLLVVWGAVELASVAAPTGRLLGLYETWWLASRRAVAAVPRLGALAVGIDRDPREINGQPLRMKLFFEPIEDGAGGAKVDDRAEIFLNVDLSARRTRLLEKDPEHREPPLRRLAGEVAPLQRGSLSA